VSCLKKKSKSRCAASNLYVNEAMAAGQVTSNLIANSLSSDNRYYF